MSQPATAVRPTDDAVGALRQVGTSGLPGLVVDLGTRFVVVPASQLLRVALPRYVLDDPTLGRVWDESSADRLAERLTGLRVLDLLAALDRDVDGPPAVVAVDATAVEVAAVMAVAHTSMVAVVDGGALVGVVTASRLIADLSR